MDANLNCLMFNRNELRSSMKISSLFLNIYFIWLFLSSLPLRFLFLMYSLEYSGNWTQPKRANNGGGWGELDNLSNSFYSLNAFWYVNCVSIHQMNLVFLSCSVFFFIAVGIQAFWVFVILSLCWHVVFAFRPV